MLDKEEFATLAQNVLFNEPMKNHTTFKIGGEADAFVDAASVEEIKNTSAYCKENGISCMIVGNGSNMLIGDKGFRGVVIHIGKAMSGVEIDGETVKADAGILMSTLANTVLKAELTGFEALSGIPGTLGGGIYMNAGAYEHDLGSIIESVTYLDTDGEIRTADKSQLDMTYRHSMFQDSGFVILSCTLKLKKGNYEAIKAAMQDYNKRRSDKQPLSVPSAGSTFKRPEGHFAGKLIQDCGLMGYSIGGAQVSEKHAGFIVNKGNATAEDVLALIRYVQKTVKEKFDVMLEPEVRLIGEQ